MSVSKYEKNGQTFWQVYVNVRSKTDPTVRKQKRVLDIQSERQALAEERRLIAEVAFEIAKAENKPLTWNEVIGKWEVAMRTDKTQFQYAPTTIRDHVSNLTRWTGIWLHRPASDLNRADGRDMLREMELLGKSRNFRKNIKHTVNVVYKWAMEERLIRGVQTSPTDGLQISKNGPEKVPDILTIDEIRKLLQYAKEMENPWYPVWAMALLTGMRNGELHALTWSDVDLTTKRITVSKSFNTRMKSVKGTKAGYWRTVPISDELQALLLELKNTGGNRQHVLPRFWEWDKGEQARVLRMFCIGIGIRSVKFHALRACFATQLLANDIAPARVMKICGWRDLKTMQFYIRLAGVDEQGATQVLKMLPSDAAMMSEVVRLFEVTK